MFLQKKTFLKTIWYPPGGGGDGPQRPHLSFVYASERRQNVRTVANVYGHVHVPRAWPRKALQNTADPCKSCPGTQDSQIWRLDESPRRDAWLWTGLTTARRCHSTGGEFVKTFSSGHILQSCLVAEFRSASPLLADCKW